MTMTLSAMFLTSCSKESINQIPTGTTNPTATSWEGSTGTVYQIELDLNTDLTIEKLDCMDDKCLKGNKPDIVNHDCGLIYKAFGRVNGYSNTLGESKGFVEMRYDKTTDMIIGFITLSYPSTNDELILSIYGQMNDTTLKVGSVYAFSGFNFIGDVIIDNVLDVFQSNSQITTSMMVVGELK